MIYHIMYKNEKVADIETDKNNKIIRFAKIMPDGIKQPFSGDNLSFVRFYDFLKDRCYEDCRENLQDILSTVGMNNNDPYKWNKITHGVTWEDYFWIKYDDENLTWEDVRVRP